MRKQVICGVASAVLLSLCGQAHAGAVFGAPSYTSSLTLSGTGDTNDVPAGVAFDGTHYYEVSGNGPSSPITEFDASGAIVAGPTAPTPGIDFRSVFSDSSGKIYARGFNSNTIYQQTSFGAFTPVATLAGGLDAQEQVVLNAAGTEYVGNDYGTLQFWDLNGNLVNTVALSLADGSYPQGRSLSILGDYALNFNAGTLSAYSLSTGALVDQTTLVGANTDFAGLFGQSYANGYFFVTTDDNGALGYQIGSAVAAVPEPATWAMLILGVGMIGFAARRRQDGAAVPV